MLAIRFHGRGGRGAKTASRIVGTVTHTYMPKLQPVEDYLKLQGRFRHLFEPTPQKDAIAHIQERVNTYWTRVKQTEQAQ